MDQRHLSQQQVTSAALAAVVKYPGWAKFIGEQDDTEIQRLSWAYSTSSRGNEILPDDFRYGIPIAFLRWLQAELQHELNARDVRFILLTIKQAFYT